MAARRAKTGRANAFKLTMRHKRFCQNVVAGMSHKAAYAAAGFSTKWTGATAALMKQPLIKEHIKYLHEIQRIRLNVTVQSLVLDFRRAQDFALASDNASAFVQATVSLAKLMGFMKEDKHGDEVNIFINRPLREPTKELELTPDQWISRWAPPPIEAKPNGHGNGHDGKANGHD